MRTIENLERRRLLSNSLVSGVLKITGNDLANTIDVTVSGSKIKVDEHNGQTANLYTASVVKSILADLKGGNDIIRFAQAITKPCTVLGGDGKDLIQPGL